MKKIIMVFLLLLSTITFSKLDIEVVTKVISELREDISKKDNQEGIEDKYNYYYVVNYPKISLDSQNLYYINNRIYKSIEEYLPTEINNYEDHANPESPYAHVGFYQEDSNFGITTITPYYFSMFARLKLTGYNFYIDIETGKFLELDDEIFQKGMIDVIINDAEHKILQIENNGYTVTSINIEKYDKVDEEDKNELDFPYIGQIYFENDFLVIAYIWGNMHYNYFKYSKEAVKPFLKREFLANHRDIFKEDEKDILDNKTINELFKIYEFKEKILSFHYKNLMSKLDEEEKKELKSSELEWIKWKEKKFKDFKKENTEKDYLIFKILVTESRVEFLKNYKNNYFIEEDY